MATLVDLATALLPELTRILAADTAGAVAADVAKAVTAATGASDYDAAKKKLDDEPLSKATLQVTLAQIALAASSTAGARDNQLALAKEKSPIMWVPSAVSMIVTLSFLIIVATLIFVPIKPDNQLLNICIGALVAGFSTVVNFWLGSSQGSREKDAASLQIQAAQAQQTTAAVNAQAQQATKVLENAANAGGSSTMVVVSTPSDNFENCLPLLLNAQGGFSSDPQNPQEASNFGIKLATLKTWKAKDVTVDDIKNLTKADAQEFYRANYWIPVRGSDLPNGVDLAVLDFAVTADAPTALKSLQKIVGVVNDGSFGPVTIAAIKVMDRHTLITRISSERFDYYHGRPELANAQAAWTARIRDIEQAALKMIG